jgi:chitin disaccharide deacetylase
LIPPHLTSVTIRQIRLIVNGDDFGISEEVNRAIIAAFQNGVLTSCSLMVTGEAFDHAVQLAKENKKLAVGIHLVTVMGRSVLPRKEIPSLVDENQNFSNNPNAAGLNYFFLPRARQDLRKELAAQFEKFKSTGLPLSHIDGHLHLHVHPVIFQTALNLGEQYGTKRMRVPVEELRLALAYDRTDVFKKTLYAFLFSSLGRYMKRKLKKRNFSFTERVYGNLQSGKMSEEYFLYVLDHIQQEETEIYFHPAHHQQEKGLNSEQQQQMKELDALISTLVKEKIQDNGIRLTNYLELEKSS